MQQQYIHEEQPREAPQPQTVSKHRFAFNPVLQSSAPCMIFLGNIIRHVSWGLLAQIIAIGSQVCYRSASGRGRPRTLAAAARPSRKNQSELQPALQVFVTNNRTDDDIILI